MNLTLALTAAVLASSPPSHELGFQVGLAQGHDSEGETHTGLGLRLHLLERFGPYLALGPETALYAHAGARTQVISSGSQESYRIHNRGLFQLGALGRAGGQLGPVRPSVLLGLAWYKGILSYLGYSVGAELEVRFVDWLPPLALDVRYHDYVHNFSYAGNPHQHYESVGLSTRLLW